MILYIGNEGSIMEYVQNTVYWIGGIHDRKYCKRGMYDIIYWKDWNQGIHDTIQ